VAGLIKRGAMRRVFVVKPLVSEDFDYLLHTKTPTQTEAEARACRYRRPFVEEQFDIPPNAPTVCLLGQTSDGSYVLSVGY
jgi:hypothetical protein